MKNNLKIYILLLPLTVSAVLLLVGCAELAKVGTWMVGAGDTTAKISQDIAPIANSVLPGSSIVLGAVSGLLSIAGGFLLKLSSKRLTTIQSLTEGVSFAAHTGADLKTAIRAKATAFGVEPYLNKLVQEFDPPAMPEETKTI